MKTAIFTASALIILINTGAAIADPAKRTKAITKPAPKAMVYQQVKKLPGCTTPTWVQTPRELNDVLNPCMPGAFTTAQPFDN